MNFDHHVLDQRLLRTRSAYNCFGIQRVLGTVYLIMYVVMQS